MESMIFIVIIAICIGLLIFGFIKHNYEAVINFILRIFAGLAAICVINVLLGLIHIDLSAGVNEYNALILGLLGIPGFLLVYGIALYYYLK